MGAKPHLEIYFFSFLQKMGTNSKAEFHLTRLADMEETFPIESIIYEGMSDREAQRTALTLTTVCDRGS